LYLEDDKREAITDVKTSGLGNNTCGLTIASITEEHFGNWKCIFPQDLGPEHQNSRKPEHQGDFTILRKEELFVKVNNKYITLSAALWIVDLKYF
jgi:hypothetical protein